ncbi:MAG: META domain-containing protein, partial [Bacteroidales bacterium]|nr:META domain-containing protein [Bacteroidales bacterium]
MKKILFYTMMFAVVTNITACGCKQKKGSQITSNTSASTEATGITDKHWKLVELNGNPIDASTAAFIFMNSSDGRVHGNLGCNSF